jgi:peptidoglycan/LPS O-acetylase OafA/YrhL
MTQGSCTDPQQPVGVGQSTLRQFRPDVEGLRAVAVLAVVIDHSGLAVHGGYVGVDVFFVISGFLITRQLFNELTRKGRISFPGFYARRVRRILPAATLVIVITLLASWEWLPPLEIHAVGIDAIYAALFCINVHLANLGTNYFANPSPSPFQQYWSLAIEEQFYILWPVLLLVWSWATRRVLSRRNAMSMFLLLVIALSLWRSVSLTETSPSWAYFGLQTRLWELALGAIIAINAAAIATALRGVAAIASWFGLVAIVFGAFFFGASTTYPGIAVALPVCGAGLVIAAGGAAPHWGAEIALSRRPAQFVGRVSYSWYLWHWPVFILLPFAIDRTPTDPEILAALCGSFVLAMVTYALVERPLRRTQGLVARPERGLLFGAGLLATSVVCAFVVMALVVIPGAGAATVKASSLRHDGIVSLASSTSTLGASIAQGARLKALPANLTPPLADVPNDTPYTCIDSPSASAPQSVCQLGDANAAQTVVLFGDSHAWQWIPALGIVAAQRGWKLVTYTKGGCPVEDVPATVAALDESSTNCAQWRNAVFAKLSALRPELVIISSQTKGFATARDMTETVKQLESDGAKIVWLEDTPYPGFNVPDCLSDHPSKIQKCGYSLSAGLYEPTVRNALNRAATKSGALVINPSPWLCTGTTCPPIVGSTVVYFDESHLSSTYSMRLAPELSAALATSMPVPPPSG